MIAGVLVVCLQTAAAAAPPPAASASMRVSTTVATSALSLSTYTVSTLYTGDHFRDPFMAASVGGGRRRRPGRASRAPDIHELQLRGIMKDAVSDFALFTLDDGSTFVLRGRVLYGARNKRIPGITGRIRIRQKRAELMTADKDVQVYILGEVPEGGRGRTAPPRKESVSE